ncbi:hypothetical protein K2173_017725 [Erythroxylum novogranatense]|uniref:Uncharacterized protein n=1 Tax=Erythroxylum novogranatense TaxID=1862640 RepID=A0AAV8SM82_9ROSI|nr:hypothetical protein K2173_017725 [Erythroxylum novogranatense]
MGSVKIFSVDYTGKECDFFLNLFTLVTWRVYVGGIRSSESALMDPVLVFPLVLMAPADIMRDVTHQPLAKEELSKEDSR